MRAPNIFTVATIQAWSVLGSQDGRTWIPARPEGFDSLFCWLRFRAAWGVLAGRLDALQWPAHEDAQAQQGGQQ